MRHRIHTYNEDPVRERLRRTPLKFQDEEERTLTDMLDAHVIKPSTSEWASAPVLVRKKDGEVRYTVDYRKLNAMTIKDAYHMPLIEECMDTLSGTLWFHTLDLARSNTSAWPRVYAMHQPPFNESCILLCVVLRGTGCWCT